WKPSAKLIRNRKPFKLIFLYHIAAGEDPSVQQRKIHLLLLLNLRLSVGRFCNRTLHFAEPAHRQEDFHFHILFILRIQQRNFLLSQQILNLPQSIIVCLYLHQRSILAFYRHALLQPFLHSLSISPDQSPGSQQRPPEIAGHHRRTVADAGSRQHIQHGLARCTLRFTVVAAPHRLLTLPQHLVPAVVSGDSVLFFHFFNKGQRFLLIFHILQRSDKS